MKMLMLIRPNYFYTFYDKGYVGQAPMMGGPSSYDNTRRGGGGGPGYRDDRRDNRYIYSIFSKCPSLKNISTEDITVKEDPTIILAVTGVVGEMRTTDEIGIAVTVIKAEGGVKCNTI
jgi:hypothetical protein